MRPSWWAFTTSTHDGFSKRSLSDRKLTRAFFSQVIVDSELRLAYHNERREIYMLFKSAESDENASNALVYNIDFDAFTLMVIPERNALMMYTGPQFSSSDLTYDEAGQQGLTYDSMADDYYNDLRTKDANLNFSLLRSTGVLEALERYHSPLGETLRKQRTVPAVRVRSDHDVQSTTTAYTQGTAHRSRVAPFLRPSLISAKNGTAAQQ